MLLKEKLMLVEFLYSLSYLRTNFYMRSQILNSEHIVSIEFGTWFSQEWMCRRKYVSLVGDKGIYNLAVKKEARKDKFRKDKSEFYDPGKPGPEKNVFLKTWFYGFSRSH